MYQKNNLKKTHFKVHYFGQKAILGNFSIVFRAFKSGP